MILLPRRYKLIGIFNCVECRQWNKHLNYYLTDPDTGQTMTAYFKWFGCRPNQNLFYSFIWNRPHQYLMFTLIFQLRNCVIWNKSNPVGPNEWSVNCTLLYHSNRDHQSCPTASGKNRIFCSLYIDDKTQLWFITSIMEDATWIFITCLGFHIITGHACMAY